MEEEIKFGSREVNTLIKLSKLKNVQCKTGSRKNGKESLGLGIGASGIFVLMGVLKNRIV